ncbi:triose-phosphate isomerase [Micrococcoides hystricis]|uniref:Triosephosphate isomerase n=1 Tax=Micrococcoides hystricis TaxID=1572761 RepID=A0ABV6P740_9MICC
MAKQLDNKFIRTPLIAGNWKMNMDHQQAITLLQKLAWTLKDANHDFERVEVAVFPPFTDLRSVQTLIMGDKLKVKHGAQDLSEHDSGAYTGDISGAFLSKLGCEYVLVGHSERRQYHGEDDEICAAKIKAAFKHELAPVLCIGEGLDVRQAGEHIQFTLAQLSGALENLVGELTEAQLGSLVVAYEPVWAIGTGEVAGPAEAGEMCTAIRGRLTELVGEEVAQQIRVLYGGSVKAESIAALMAEEDIDGALVGGASLDATEFANIVRFEHHLMR